MTVEPKKQYVKCANKLCGKEMEWGHGKMPLPNQDTIRQYCSPECYRIGEMNRKERVYEDDREVDELGLFKKKEKQVEEKKPAKELKTTTEDPKKCEHFMVERSMNTDGTYKPTGRCLDCGHFMAVDPKAGTVTPKE